jgi:hypothetical protein
VLNVFLFIFSVSFILNEWLICKKKKKKKKLKVAWTGVQALPTGRRSGWNHPL